MEWLFDTNVLSESIRPRPDRMVMSRLGHMRPEQVAISILTLAELIKGAQATPTMARRDELITWINNDLRPSFGERILLADIHILTEWLGLTDRVLAARSSRKSADLLIAATARIHRLTLVTRNWRDFAGTGVAAFDPWTGETHRMHLL